MQSVLDAPVPTTQAKQLFRVGFLGPQARDGVRNVSGSLVTNDSSALDTNRLCKARPIKIASKTAAALKMPNLNSAVPLVNRPALVKLLTAQPFAVGGKGRD